MTKAFNDNSEVTSISQQMALLKKHFPQCFDKHGAFMADKLQEIVGDSGTAFSKESYRLNWLGKSYARLLANENPLTFLSEDKTHNQKPEHCDSENLLIKGDNLEVLKHLKHAYREQVKMIYIDPPYNTGSDGFVYQDDRKFSAAQLARLAGIERDEAQRILDFTQSKANSHSAWLTFMYPRLYVARELLKDDGVIFISIDDNEVAQLRILCDEVFGEENFIGLFVVNASPSGIDYGHLAKTHDYAIFYAKNIEYAVTNQLREESKEFKYSDTDGGFNIYPLYNGNVAFNPTTRPNLYYQFYLNVNNKISDDFYEISLDPHEGWIEVWPVISRKEGISRVWRWGKKKAQEGLNKEIIGYKNELGEYRIVQKSRHTTKVIRSLLLDNEVSSRRGTGDFEKLFNGKIFTFPKSVELVRRFVEIGTDTGDLILDFFAGSGTTAQSVMELNASDNGTRKFILVQIPEPCDKKSEAYKAGFKTIFDITQARIEKAAAKIKADNPIFHGDLGFKLFETVPVPDGYGEELEALDSPNSDLFDGSLLDEQQLNDLLTTWKVYDGIALTAPLLPVDLAGYRGWQHQNLLYLVHKNFSTAALTTLLQKLDDTEDKAFNLERLVLFAHNFDSKHQREISEAMKQYQNRKQKSVSVELRY